MNLNSDGTATNAATGEAVTSSLSSQAYLYHMIANAHTDEMFSFMSGERAFGARTRSQIDINDVLDNPSVLNGRSLNEVRGDLKIPHGWEEGALTRGRRTGKGWTLRQVNARGNENTGLYLQYSPGSPRHFGGSPYWKFSSGTTGKQWFPAE